MRNAFQWVFGLCLLLLPITIWAQSDSNSNSLQTLITESGSEVRLAYVADFMSAEISGNPFELDSTKNARLQNSFQAAFQMDSLRKYFHERLSEQLTPSFIDSSLTLIQRDSIHTVLDAKKEFNTLQGLRKQVVSRYELDKEGIADNRAMQIKSLMENQKLTQFTVDSQVLIFRSIIKAYDHLNTEQSFSDTQVDAFTNNFRMRAESTMTSNLNNRYQIMYYDIDDPTLEYYISVFRSGLGKRLNEAFSTSMIASYEKAVQHFLSSIED
jgi:hypothetical protein